MIEKQEMRLFVWAELAPDYDNGLAFAIAPTVQDAQAMVVEKLGYSPSIWGPWEEFPLNLPVCFVVDWRELML